MQSDLSDIEQRVKRYWYSDGIGELISGGMFILLGIYFAAQTYLGEKSLIGGLLQAGLIIFLLGGMAIGRRLIKALKSRVTYPRTGYVEYQVDKRSKNKWRIIVAMATAVLVAFALVFAQTIASFLDLTVALTGILFGGILIVLQGRGAGLERFYVLGGMAIVLGIALAFSSLPEGYSLGLFYSLMGIASSISGAIVLRRYLQENPFPAEAERE